MNYKLTSENYQTNFLRFRDRQAGIGLVYCPDEQMFWYNVYCIETKLLKELVSVEFEFLEDALEMVNEDFATWDLGSFEEKKAGCGSCVAKKG